MLRPFKSLRTAGARWGAWGPTRTTIRGPTIYPLVAAGQSRTHSAKSQELSQSHTSSFAVGVFRVGFFFFFAAPPAVSSCAPLSSFIMEETLSLISAVATPPESRPRARIARILAVPPSAIT